MWMNMLMCILPLSIWNKEEKEKRFDGLLSAKQESRVCMYSIGGGRDCHCIHSNQD